MEEAMPLSWTIAAEWESLDSGPPEERACFAALGINIYDHWLTEGHDILANRLRQKPLLSAYHLAEWLAWNWWRLRWEPRCPGIEWSQSHRMSAVGSGYIWPDITIFSDGERIAFIARATNERFPTPFRYISNFATVITAREFEMGLDEFFEMILNRLDAEGVPATNFHQIWQSLREERATPELAHIRKLEALLGAEPDEADRGVLDQFIADAGEFGFESVEELAAEGGRSGSVSSIEQLKEVADERGHDFAPKDAVRLETLLDLRRGGDVPAWKLGARAAAALREQEHLDGEVISDQRLASMAGTSPGVLTDSNHWGGFSFAIYEKPDKGHEVLRSKWHTGRRFELARLLGDRLLMHKESRFFPATRSHTYRQKMQRAFAAELLSPFETVEEMLGGDYSMENQRDVAEHFQVSDRTILTLLVNHHRLDRDELEGDADLVA